MDSRLELVSCIDLLKDQPSLNSLLKGKISFVQTVSHVYFYGIHATKIIPCFSREIADNDWLAYKQDDDNEKECRINEAMLR
jgi:hypothetical protein